MRVVIAKDLSVRLDDPDNFRDFKIVAHTPADDMAAIAVALRDASAGEAEAAHGWISQTWLRAQESRSEWRESLHGMLSYAQTKGWLNERGSVRAHIDWSRD